MIDITKRYKTRDGMQCHIISIENMGAYPVIGEYYMEDGSVIQNRWTLNGMHAGYHQEHGLDLVEVTEAHAEPFNGTDPAFPIEQDPYGKDAHAPGAKLDAGKPDAALLIDFARALTEVAKVATYGAQKYSRGGWQHVEDGRHRYTAALIRHILSEKTTETDDESKMLHASHAAWNALARLELLLRERDAG